MAKPKKSTRREKESETGTHRSYYIEINEREKVLFFSEMQFLNRIRKSTLDSCGNWKFYFGKSLNVDDENAEKKNDEHTHKLGELSFYASKHITQMQCHKIRQANGKVLFKLASCDILIFQLFWWNNSIPKSLANNGMSIRNSRGLKRDRK